MKRIAVFAFLFYVWATTGFAQNVQVSRANKTIAVTAEESVSADPDLAIVTFGYSNYGATEKDAYEENLRVADKIVKAVVGAGFDKHSIESDQLVVDRAEQSEDWKPEQRKLRQFRAYQSWKMRVPVAKAQGLVDLAMAGGANIIQSVDWEVMDRDALQAKAGGAALARARAIAEQMAKGLGVKLGDLVYASNYSSAMESFMAVEGKISSDRRGSGTPADKVGLTLFPQKVKEQATVTAVFAIE